MARLSGSGGALDYYAAKRRRIAEEQKKLQPKKLIEDDQQVQDVSAVADNIAEMQVKMPVDQIKEGMPVVSTDETNIPVEESTPVGPIEKGSRAELLGKVGEDLPVGATPEKIADLSETSIPAFKTEGDDLYQDAVELTEDEKLEQYKQQIQDEAQFRLALSDDGSKDFGELVDKYLVEDYGRKQTSDDDDASIQLFSDMLDFAGKSVQADQTKFNIFGKTIDVSQAGKELLTDPHGFLKANSDMISYAIKGADKLDMLEDRSDINSNIRPEVGRAMLVATILEISQRLNQQGAETDKEANRRQYDNALDRVNIGKAIGARIERLLYPSSDIDTSKPYTGETEGFGYKYRLTEQERSLLGQAVVQGLADSPNFNFMESHFVKEPGETEKGKWSFRPDRNGDQQLYKIRRALKDVMGLNEYDRPVSLVPTTKEGRLRGEGATTQKQITSQLIKNKLPVKVQQAIEKLGRVAHTVPPHKVLLGAAMLNSDNRFFRKIRKADDVYFKKKYDEFYREYKAREEADPNFARSIGFKNIKEAANRQTVDIMDRHREMRMNQLFDAMNRMDSSFYYGYTAINNSSRLMITNQELNYQADKLARFFVDGARPVIFKKNSNSAMEMSPDGFFGVIARSVIPDAGKMPPERQVALLLEDLSDPKGSKYLKYGKELLAFTEANKDLIGKLRGFKENRKKGEIDDRAIVEERYQEALANAETDQDMFAAFIDAVDPNSAMNQMPGQKPQISPDAINKQFSEGQIQLSEELTEYFEKIGKDEFYFAMDALHELARWDATPTGVEFKTRVKAEADGNANGATILGMQMGVANIMEKGGVLYSKTRLEQLAKGLTHAEIDEIEDDIRDDVFRHMETFPQVNKEIGNKMNHIFTQIKAKGKVKELMKQPIMTSIYGKDARYHGDTARKFIRDNPELFSAFSDDILKAEKLLTQHLEHALVTGLGGALEHSRVMKRVGRAFNFANRIAQIEGPNGFYSQAGGHEYINDTPQPTIFDFIQEGMTDEEGNVLRRTMAITTKQRIPSAQAKAGGVKLDTGFKSITDNGSKLRNQIAVNSTQNIDAAVAQQTAIDILSNDPNATFMQVYDAFMGDAASFGKIRRQANKNFNDINKKYLLVQKELEAFQQLKKDIEKDVGKKIAAGENYDIGLEGDYRTLGDFVFNGSRIAMRDMPADSDLQQKTKEDALLSLKSKMMIGMAKRYNIDLPKGQRDSPKDFQEMKRVIIPPQLYLEFINYAFETLNIEKDLLNFLSRVKKQRAEVFKQQLREGQYS